MRVMMKAHLLVPIGDGGVGRGRWLALQDWGMQPRKSDIVYLSYHMFDCSHRNVSPGLKTCLTVIKEGSESRRQGGEVVDV